MHSSLFRVFPLVLLAGLVTSSGVDLGSGIAGGAPLHLTAGPPELTPVPGNSRVVPRLVGFGLTTRPGEPMLPVRVLLVAIPEGSVPEIRILSTRSAPLRGLDVVPVPHMRAGERTEEGEARTWHSDFDADEKIFGRDAEFPSAPVRLGATGYMREQRFVEVLFTPVVYNPVRRQGRYFTDIRAEVLFTGVPGADLSSGQRQYRPDPLFEEAYRRSFVNYEEGKLFRVLPGQVTGSASSQQTVAASTTLATAGGAPRYKILVSRSGIYHLDYAYLSSHAPDLLLLDPSTYVLTAEGVEIPLSIRDPTGASGEQDGRFDPGDVLDFYGRLKTESPTILNYDSGTMFPAIYQANDCSDTQVYWLTSAGAPGSHPRMRSASGAPATPGFQVAGDFEAEAVWDENNLYLPLGDADPFFSIPSLLAGSTQAQRDLTLGLPGLASSPATATVKVRLRGGSDLSSNPDHRTQVWINKDSAGGADFTWDGQVVRETEFAVPGSDLTNSTTIHFSLPGLPGVSLDRQYLDTVSIRYRRAFSALGDELDFSYPNGDARFVVAGFSAAAPTIYELTQNLPGSAEADPVRITGAAVSGSAPFTYTFEVAHDPSPSAPATRTFVVAGPAGLRLPDAMVRAADPVLKDPQNSADFLVIASRDTVDTTPGGSLDRLLSHRLSTQGLTSKVVFMDQIYDEFNDGVEHVNALRSFLSYAYDNWRGSDGSARPPSYVLLVGDATPDYKNTMNRTDWVDQVPTPILFQTNAILGYYSSDNWIASFRGNDQVPDVYLGRISTRTAAASGAVFDKILRYEESPPPGLWKGRAILVAGDGKDASDITTFEGLQDKAAGYFSAAPYSVPNPPLYFARPPWNSTDAASFKSAILTELQGGAAALSFVGHGSFDVWGLTTFFTTQDAEALTTSGSIPVMLNVNCLAGGFHYFLASGSIGEAMTNNSTGGAIATLAPSGLSFAFLSGDLIVDQFFGSLFGPRRERILGAADNRVRLGLWSQGSITDLQSYTFLGDPATVLATPAPPPPTALTATAGNGEVNLSWSPPLLPVAGYRIYRSAFYPSGQYAPVDCAPVGVTSCVDQSVTNATTYYYYARSVDTDGFEGAASNFNTDCDSGPDCVVARPINPGPPSAPTGLASRDPGTGGELDVSWLPNPEPDIKTYTLHYGVQPGQYSAQLITGPAGSTAVLGGLTNAVRYYLALSATNTSGKESALSAEISNVPHLFQGIAPPRAITDLEVYRSGSDLVLTWSRPTVDIYGRPTTVVRYDVYRGSSVGFQPFTSPPLATILDGAVTTYVHTGAALLAGNSYYLVTARDSSGLVSAAGRELPNGIDNLSVSRIGASTIRLGWSPVTTDISGLPTIVDHYQIHMANHPVSRGSLGPSTLVRDGVGVTSVDLSAPGGTLYFSVIAVDNRGNLSPF